MKYIHFNSFVDVDRKGLRMLKRMTRGRHADRLKFAVIDINDKGYAIVPYTTMSDIDQWSGILIIGGVNLVSLHVADVVTDIDKAITMQSKLQMKKILDK